MNILYVSQYYPPEVGAPAARVSELSKYWVKKGHNVTVLTGFPNYPMGEPYSGFDYGNRIYKVEDDDGVKVVRIWELFGSNQGVWPRIKSYVSFMLSGLLAGPFIGGQFDVVIATSPQLLVGVVGEWIAKLKRIPWVFEVRDLWPEELTAHRVGRIKIIYNTLDALANHFYRDSKVIVCVTEKFREYLIEEKKISPEKIEVVTNGVDIEFFKPGDRINRFREKYQLGDQFIVSYIGNHGYAQGLQAVIRAAEKLRDLPDVKFVFVGEGAEKENLIKLVKELNLEDRFMFLPKHPKEWMPDIYRASDVCIVSLLDHKLNERSIPSKIFEIFGCRRPMVASVGEQPRKIIEEECGSGLCVPAGDVEGIAASIRKLYASPQLREELAEAGYRGVREKFSRQAKAEEYLKILEEKVMRK